MSHFRGVPGCEGQECCPTIPGGEQEEPHATTAGGREDVRMGRGLTLDENNTGNTSTWSRTCKGKPRA